MARFSMGLPRLYFRFYVALLFILVLFTFAVVMIWNRTGSPLERSNNTLAQVMQNVLAPIDAPPEVQQEALARVAAGLNAHMTLYTRDWRPLAVVGEQIPARHWRRLEERFSQEERAYVWGMIAYLGAIIAEVLGGTPVSA